MFEGAEPTGEKFSLSATDGTVRKRRYSSPIPNDPLPAPIPAAQLDDANHTELHHRLVNFYTRELDRQYTNRAEQAEEADVYDNIQWSDDDAATLEERGQKALVYNVTSATVDWVLGTEERTRTDYKVQPRRKEDGKPAERKSQLLKYLDDVNQTPFNQSRAFEDAVKVGIGWLECGYQDEDDGEPVYDAYESWRNMLWDSAATRLDVENGRYQFRTKFVDLDIIQAAFPERAQLLAASANASDDFISLDAYGDPAMDSQERHLENQGNLSPGSDNITGYQRRRVRATEGWIKVPTQAYRMRGGAFSGELFDPFSIAHLEEVHRGDAEAVKKPTLKVHCALFTSTGLIWFGPSPYRHNRFPFTPIWGYRRDRDGMPYGLIRRIKDPQFDINKRASKALFIMSTNKVIYDKGAFDDPDEAREEIARPDAFLEKNPGKEVKTDVDRELGQFQLQMMEQSMAMIERAGGVTNENLGRKSNVTAGIAIARKQDQGQLATTKLFGHLRLARQVHGEKKLSLVEQFYTEEKSFRITGISGKNDWPVINNSLPENDIIRSKADFIIGEAEWQSTLRQANVEALLTVIARMPPQIGLILLDMAVENMDLPNREELVRRIRSITGQRDPNNEEPTPEEQQRDQQAAEDQKLQRDVLHANLRKTLSEASKNEATARHIVTQLVGTNVDAQNKALAAAREALLAPASVPIADHILGESGFQSQSDLAAATMDAARQAATDPNMQQAPGINLTGLQPGFSPAGLPPPGADAQPTT